MAEEVVKETVKKGGGCGPMFFVILFMVLLSVLFGANMGLGWYGTECGDEDIFECIERITQDVEDDMAGEVVTATGPYSYKDTSVVMTLTIPLKGGKVEGKVTGDCSGRVTGTFDGNDDGVLTGSFAGNCSPFFVNIPAKATLSGTVIQKAKAVPIGFQGSGGGFTHSDSMTLSY